MAFTGLTEARAAGGAPPTGVLSLTLFLSQQPTRPTGPTCKTDLSLSPGVGKKRGPHPGVGYGPRTGLVCP